MPVAPRIGAGVAASQDAPRKKRRVLFPHLLQPAAVPQNLQPTDCRNGSSEIETSENLGSAVAKKGADRTVIQETSKTAPTGQQSKSDEAQSVTQTVTSAKSSAFNATVEQETNSTSGKISKPAVEKDSRPIDGASPSSSKEVLTWDGLKLSTHDLSCLEEGNMLNDAVIDFFMRLLHRYLLPRDDIYVFSCHFFTRLTAAGAADGEIGWENVKRWTKRINLFGYRYALVPINSELHWWLAVVEFSVRDTDLHKVRLAWVDSLPGEVSRYKHVEHYLCGYLQREWRERRAMQADGISKPFLECQVSEKCEAAPHQENGIDCGVFLLENILQLLAGTCGPTIAKSEKPDAVPLPWCDQPQAFHRRGCLRRTAHRLQAEMGAPSSGKTSAAVPELLEGRPEVVKRLRCLWGLPSQCSWMAAECSRKL